MKKLLYSGLTALLMLFAFTGLSTAQTVTFSPDPDGDPVAAGTAITITVSPTMAPGDVYFKRYADLTTAKSKAYNDFYSNVSGVYTLANPSTNLQVTETEKAFAVAIMDENNDYAPIILGYAEYTLTGGGETPVQPTEPTVALTFKPGTGTTVAENRAILIQWNEANAQVYYKLYADLDAAKADNDSWSDKANLTQYTGVSTAPQITPNNTVIKAAAWLTDKWDVFSYAEYTLQAATPTDPDYQLTLSPDGNADVEDPTSVTITASPALESNYSIFWKTYASVEAANQATWPEGERWPEDLTPYASNNVQSHPKITAQARVLKAAVLNTTSLKWVASSNIVKEYTIAQATREPFVISFDPEAGKVEANTRVTLSTTPELTEGFELYYKLYDSVSNAKKDAWTILDLETSLTKYTDNDKPRITEAKPILKMAIWNSTSREWESDTIAEYAIPQEEPDPEITLTFNPVSGSEVNENDTVKIECSSEEAVVFFMMFDTKANAEAISNEAWQDAMIEYGEPIEDEENLGYPVITKAKPVIKAGYADVDEEENMTWNFFYAEYTVKENGKPAKPVFTPAAGAVDSNTVVTIAKGTADSIFVAFGKTINDAVAFAKYTADVTVNIVKDTFIRAYAMKDGLYSDTVNNAYTIKSAATVQDTVKTPTFSVAAGEVEKGTKVTINCATEGAKIYYTLNGDVPTAQSTEYTAAITIDSAMTIKAIAVKEGWVDSKVAEASYTIKKVANEGAELAGVRLYPNPNNGEFNVSVPVRVQVEVFTLNGMMVKAITIAQGNTQIRLENSGIYFIRFTAENGQVAVRRVVVR